MIVSMNAAECPSCGLPVIPGYARCPKCHAALPRLQTSAGGTTAGGTALETHRSPVTLGIVAVAVAVGVILLLKVMFGGGGDRETDPKATPPGTQTAAPNPSAPEPSQPEELPFAEDQAPAAPRIQSGAAARQLEATLRRQRLWSKIEVFGARVDVRSGACEDPQMVPTISSVGATLREAGLTHVRCLAQSGSVVFERDL